MSRREKLGLAIMIVGIVGFFDAELPIKITAALCIVIVGWWLFLGEERP